MLPDELRTVCFGCSRSSPFVASHSHGALLDDGL
jgi:hypothetical protein